MRSRSTHLIVLHERRGIWARQLRPRLLDLPIRWSDSRSRRDWEVAVQGIAGPIVVVDLTHQPERHLSDLAAIGPRMDNPMILVIDPDRRPARAKLVRELGATHGFSGVTTPPEVESLLRRWVAIRTARRPTEGWQPGPDDDLDTLPDDLLELAMAEIR